MAALKRAGIRHKAVSWDDVLHDGPVPATDPSALRKIRAEYLSTLGPEGEGSDSGEIEVRLAARDTLVDGWAGPITLWFEHDLYDQLQLVQILDRLYERPDVFVIQQDDFIAEKPGGPSAWQEFRRPVTGAQRKRARRAWKAFTATTPEAAAGLLAEPGSDLPHLRAALRRWFESFPGVFGLSRTEALVLDLLAAGSKTGAQLFTENQRHEEAAFRGDWSFWKLLDEMGNLLESTGEEHPARRTWSISELGERVRTGAADRVDSIGLDRWRGGTHLTPRHDWRWVDGALAFRTPG